MLEFEACSDVRMGAKGANITRLCRRRSHCRDWQPSARNAAICSHSSTQGPRREPGSFARAQKQSLLATCV